MVPESFRFPRLDIRQLFDSWWGGYNFVDDVEDPIDSAKLNKLIHHIGPLCKLDSKDLPVTSDSNLMSKAKKVMSYFPIASIDHYKSLTEMERTSIFEIALSKAYGNKVKTSSSFVTFYSKASISDSPVATDPPTAVIGGVESDLPAATDPPTAVKKRQKSTNTSKATASTSTSVVTSSPKAPAPASVVTSTPRGLTSSPKATASTSVVTSTPRGLTSSPKATASTSVVTSSPKAPAPTSVVTSTPKGLTSSPKATASTSVVTSTPKGLTSSPKATASTSVVTSSPKAKRKDSDVTDLTKKKAKVSTT